MTSARYEIINGGSGENHLTSSMIEIPKLTELIGYACNSLVKEGMDVCNCPNKDISMRIYHEICGFAKNIEVMLEDIKYPIFSKDKK